MIAIAGVILVAAAFYLGIETDISITRLDYGQLLLIAGVALASRDLMWRYRKLLEAMPLILGLATLGLGFWGGDVWIVTGGAAILAAYRFPRPWWSARKPATRRRKA